MLLSLRINPITHFFMPHFAPRRLSEFYIALALRNFAIGLIGIFEPIYLFLHLGQSVSLMLFYFAAISFLFGILSPLGAKLCVRFGAKRTMLASTPFFFLYYVGLWLLPSFLSPVFFAGLIALRALDALLYWPAYHLYFTHISSRENRGRNMSSIMIIFNAVSAVAPFLGGLVLMQFGFPFLFGLVLFALAISGIPLMTWEDNYPQNPGRLREIIRLAWQHAQRGKAIGFAAVGVESSVSSYIWPLFLFLLAINFETLGFIASGTLFVSLFFMRFIGIFSDRRGSSKLLPLGAIANALSWPLKTFVRMPFDAFFVQTLYQFTSALMFIPLDATIYNWWSKQEGVPPVRLILVREIFLNVSRAAALGCFAILFLFTDTLSIAFWLAGFASLGVLFVLK